MIDAGLAVVLATDFNPGSSPTPSIPMMLSLAATQMKMTPAEGVTAATINAAYSLGRGDRDWLARAGQAGEFRHLRLRRLSRAGLLLWDSADACGLRARRASFGCSRVAADVGRVQRSPRRDGPQGRGTALDARLRIAAARRYRRSAHENRSRNSTA